MRDELGLNPDLQSAEYEACFRQLQPKVVLAIPGSAQPARDAARGLNIAVVDVIAEPEAGAFVLRSDANGARSTSDRSAPQPDDIAFIVMTSGTTGGSKLVPLTHRAACLALAVTAERVPIGGEDRFLNLTPLFHLLGIQVGLLAPLFTGGSTVLTNGFQVSRFFGWLDEYRPTWFAAVPTILQNVLEHAAGNQDVLNRASIRFIRTSGAPMAPSLASGIETIFNAPLLQIYGLSEAPVIASQIYGAPRRRGSCGRPAHNEVAIMDDAGRQLPPGETGEVVVRGPILTPGYLCNPEANRAAFRDGWFHTGDLGYFDAENDLFLTGRATEFINRGGEKISPLEVDNALLAHPAVAEAVAFSAPHEKLGEDVAAAVVLRKGTFATEAQLQAFVARRLAAHKLPRSIIFLDKIPVGPTGKVLRSALRDYLVAEPAVSSNGAGQRVEPRDDDERTIAAVFSQALHIDQIGIHDSFFDLGGDSIAATECAAVLREKFSCNLTPGVFLYASTVALVKKLIDDPARMECESEVIPIQPEGDGIPLFLIHPGFETTRLSRHLGRNHPLFGIPVPKAQDSPAPRSIDQMAAECARALRRFRPEGPYALAGWCAAGGIALETARKLEHQGGEIAFVVMLDVRNLFLPPMGALRKAWVRFVQRIRRATFVTRRWPGGIFDRARAMVEPGQQAALPETTHAILSHRPQPWTGRMVHIWASNSPHGRYFEPAFGWNHLAPAGFVFHEVQGDHLTMLQEPNVAEVARLVEEELDRAEGLLSRQTVNQSASWSEGVLDGSPKLNV